MPRPARRHRVRPDAPVLACTCLACALALMCMCLAACGSSSPSPTSTQASPVAQAPSSEDAAPSPSTTGRLHVEGTQLVGSNGEPVQLKGISTHGLAWFSEYVNEDCFATLKNWGCSVVRLALYTAESGGYCTDGDTAQLLELLDQGVRFATDLDMYVIVDWHILSDGDPMIHLDQAKDFFANVSGRYASHDNVIYEICNEPNGSTTWDTIKSYADEVIPVIRANDPEGIIIVGTPTWSQRVDEAASSPITGYDDIMYALHFYAATHKEDLRAKLVAAHDAGLPVFVTEFGICDASGSGGIDEASAQAWIELLDEYDISYIMWNLSNKAETSAILLPGVTRTSGFTADDLSPAGTWFVSMLKGELPASEHAAAAKQQVTGTSKGLVVSYSVKNSWEQDGENCSQYELSITNETKAPVDSWSIEVPLDTAFALVDGWNGEYAQDGTTLRITSRDYNARIEAGATIGDIGFIVRLG